MPTSGHCEDKDLNLPQKRLERIVRGGEEFVHRYHRAILNKASHPDEIMETVQESRSFDQSQAVQNRELPPLMRRGNLAVTRSEIFQRFREFHELRTELITSLEIPLQHGFDGASQPSCRTYYRREVQHCVLPFQCVGSLAPDATFLLTRSRCFVFTRILLKNRGGEDFRAANLSAPYNGRSFKRRGTKLRVILHFRSGVWKLLLSRL